MAAAFLPASFVLPELHLFCAWAVAPNASIATSAAATATDRPTLMTSSLGLGWFDKRFMSFRSAGLPNGLLERVGSLSGLTRPTLRLPQSRKRVVGCRNDPGDSTSPGASRRLTCSLPRSSTILARPRDHHGRHGSARD